MTNRDYCGNEEALIALVYDEGDAAERAAMTAHVAACATCAAELDALRQTRTHLTAWTPPEAALGFRVTQEPARVLTSPRWFARPLPAWAQMAAAIVLFAGGVVVGTSRAPEDASADQLAQLRADVARLQTVSAPAAAPTLDEDAVLRRAETIVDARVRASEARLRDELVRETAQLARDFRVVRTRDLQTVQANVDGLKEVASTELLRHRQRLDRQEQAFGEWDQVLRGGGQVVPTSLTR